MEIATELDGSRFRPAMSDYRDLIQDMVYYLKNCAEMLLPPFIWSDIFETAEVTT